jgi:hypothetical protein
MNPVYIEGAPEGHQMMRDKVALENGFSLYKLYSEKQAAAFWGKDISTMKRHRRKGIFEKKFPTKHGEDGVMYLGVYIADLIIWGTGKWPNEPEESSDLETGGLPKGPAPTSGTVSGSTPKADRQLVSALAQTTFRKQKGS